MPSDIGACLTGIFAACGLAALSSAAVALPIQQNAIYTDETNRSTPGGLTTPTARATETIPADFSQAYLSGKTFYMVWHGTGQDTSGNDIEDVPVVLQIDFEADGTAIGTGLLSHNDVQSTWAVDGTGLLYFDGNPAEGNRIACNHSDDFIRTHYLVDGEFDTVDLFFFDRQKALDVAATLTQGPAPCLSASSMNRVPSAQIDVDGLNSDWGTLAPVVTDPAGDQNGNSATDILALYAAADEERGKLAVLLQVAGTVQMPHTDSQEYSHYNVNLDYSHDIDCSTNLEGQLLNDFANAAGQNWHFLNQFVPDGSIIDYPTTTAHQGSFLETSFDLDRLPPGARAVRFYPSTRSYTAFPEHLETVHDEVRSACYLLPFAFATQPSVVSTQPADGAVGVGVNQPLVVQFDRSMNPDCDVESTDWLGRETDGQVSWSQTLYPNDTVTFTLATPLLSSLWYEASFECVDTDGVPVDVFYDGVELGFVTAGAAGDDSAPRVTSTRPYAGQSGGLTLPIVVLFDKPIDPASATDQSLQLTGPGSPAYRWRSQGNALLIWPQGLQAQSDYQLTLSTAITDGEGHGLAAPYSLDFNTGTGDIGAPTLVQTMPADLSQQAPWETRLAVYFSESMSPDSIRANETVAVFDESNADARVGIDVWKPSVDEDEGHSRIEITRSFEEGDRWQFGHTYRVEIDGGITDLWGNPLGGDHVFRFTADGDPTTVPPTLDREHALVAYRQPDGRVTLDLWVDAWSNTGGDLVIDVTDLTQTGKHWDDLQYDGGGSYHYQTPDGGDEGLTAGRHDLRIRATDQNNGQSRSLDWTIEVFAAVPTLSGGPADGETGVARQPEFSFEATGVADAAAHELVLVDADDADRLIHRIPLLTDTGTDYRAQVPASRALEAGKRYRWWVQSMDTIEVQGGFALSASRVFTTASTTGDQDGDGVADAIDNCPSVPNADQANHDTDAAGDACDTDDDNDGRPDDQDAFPLDPAEWDDTDQDGLGNNADLDDDDDGRPDTADNCPLVKNPDQSDFDLDGIGDHCDVATERCESAALAIPSRTTFIPGVHRIASAQILTSTGDVQVQPGADVTVSAPTLTFSPGFTISSVSPGLTVSTGAHLLARSETVDCSASRGTLTAPAVETHSQAR